MKESEFQSKIIKIVKNTLKDCIVLKNDSSYMQGIPDLLILYKNKWAMLECKKNSKAHRQPNQEYFVNLLNKMSFATFIFPENFKEVLHELFTFMLS